MTTRLMIPIAVVAAVALIAMAEDSGAADRVTVARVIDGDTFVTDTGARVRLWGVNAPEASNFGGKAATVYLTHMIEGKRLQCVKVDTDRYGRTVAWCELAGRDIACAMVAAGHANDMPSFSGGAYAACRP